MKYNSSDKHTHIAIYHQNKKENTNIKPLNTITTYVARTLLDYEGKWIANSCMEYTYTLTLAKQWPSLSSDKRYFHIL